MKCKQCNTEYEAKRATSLYCSTKCKQLSYRNKPVTVTDESVTLSVTAARPMNWGLPDCQCQVCQSNRSNRHTINHGAYKRAGELNHNELNRVPLPGDPDYKGCCVEVDGAWTTKEARTQPQQAVKDGQTIEVGC